MEELLDRAAASITNISDHFQNDCLQIEAKGSEMAKMWSRTYRDHFIMAFPSFDTETRKWRAQADISWSAGNCRDSAFVRYPRHADTEVQAVNVALQQSLKWVDGRIVSGPANSSSRRA